MSVFWSDPFSRPYFICANSEGSGETAWMCRLAWAFAVAYVISTIISWAGSNVICSFQLCILYVQFLMHYLKCVYMICLSFLENVSRIHKISSLYMSFSHLLYPVSRDKAPPIQYVGCMDNKRYKMTFTTICSAYILRIDEGAFSDRTISH